MHVACNLSFIVKNKGVCKVIFSNVHFKSGSSRPISGTELERDSAKIATNKPCLYSLRKSSNYDDRRCIDFVVICLLHSFSNGMFCVA